MQLRSWPATRAKDDPMHDDDERILSLVELGRALSESRYEFVTVSPETHRRVEARAAAAGARHARSVRDVFGWCRPFRADLLPSRIHDAARAADVLVRCEGDGDVYRSRVRFSSLGDRLFAHSAYPTTEADSVFFGPDTYRYATLVEETLRRGPRPHRVVDIGCGSGAGGIVATDFADRVVLSDVNDHALLFAEVNARLANVLNQTEIRRSDVLHDVSGPIDVVLANPPYMLDPGRRAYRDGGGALGEALAVRIARESLERLSPGGRLVLYTGSAIVDGVDTFYQAVRDVCEGRFGFTYHELDPDVFGEEIEHNDAYASVDRIAAVALVVRR